MTREEAIAILDGFKHNPLFNEQHFEALDMAISALKGEWIPVSERLPKAYQKILVTYEEIHWANEPMTYSVKLISFGGIVDFIAWQPLPEPYQKGGE